MLLVFLLYKKYLVINLLINLLDPIPARIVFPAFKTTYKWLETNRVIAEFKYLDSQILLALDGTEYYSSKKRTARAEVSSA